MRVVAVRQLHLHSFFARHVCHYIVAVVVVGEGRLLVFSCHLDDRLRVGLRLVIRHDRYRSLCSGHTLSAHGRVFQTAVGFVFIFDIVALRELNAFQQECRSAIAGIAIFVVCRVLLGIREGCQHITILCRIEGVAEADTAPKRIFHLLQ